MKDWLQIAGEWLSLLQPVVWGFILWAWWSLKKMFVRQEDCDSCRKEIHNTLDDLTQKQTVEQLRHEALEKALKDLPTSKDMQDIALALKTMEGDMKVLNATAQGQERALTKVEKAVDDLVNVHLENRK